ncbi:hypothetical protein GGH96_003845 [Coemansia sp. RSA 1972]|nr:hypothetical protein GGH96_003845 [Coemansia sp. RSA 1972]
MVMTTLHCLRKHIYIDFAHFGDVGKTAQDTLIVEDSASSFMGVYPSDVAEAVVKKFKTSLQRCWEANEGVPGWTQYLPQIIASYAVTQAESVGNTPAAVFFGPNAARPGEAFMVRATDSAVQTKQAIRQCIEQQVLQHRTMIQTRANAHANRAIRKLWFKPGEWVTTQMRPYLPNLAHLHVDVCPFRVIVCYGTTYQLSFANGVLMPSKMPGDALTA